MTHTLHRSLACLALCAAGLVNVPALAKLPPPSDEAKAKAAEAAAKAAYADKVGGWKLCLAQDRVAATYRAAMKAAGKEVKPADTPACAEPAAFVYPPPAAPAAAGTPPLEAAGAHSPAKTAAAPPSSKTPAADMPAKK